MSDEPQTVDATVEEEQCPKCGMPLDPDHDCSAVKDIDDYVPSGAELVVSDPRDEHEVFAVLDRHDEELILREFQRRALKVMLYDFPLDGQKVVDLSYQGVNEAVRLMNATGKVRIAIDKTSLQVEYLLEDLGSGVEPCIVVTVYASEGVTGYGQFGTAIAPRRMKLKPDTAAKKRKQGKHVDEDGRIADPFARQKAFGKAQRNALKLMVPEQIRQTMIAQYRGDDVALRQIKAGAGAEALAELPPPLTDEKAVAQKNEARGVYQEIRELDRLALLPAQFHQYLTRAEHSHERLDEFLAYLRGRLDEVREKAGAAA